MKSTTSTESKKRFIQREIEIAAQQEAIAFDKAQQAANTTQVKMLCELRELRMQAAANEKRLLYAKQELQRLSNHHDPKVREVLEMAAFVVESKIAK